MYCIFEVFIVSPRYFSNLSFYRIPNDDPSCRSMILSANEFDRLRGTSKVFTQSEREARLQASKEERERQEVLFI